MADQQIEDLTLLSNPGDLAAADELIVNDKSDTTNDAGGEPKRAPLSAAGILVPGGTKTASFTAVTGEFYELDAEAGTANQNFIITFPASPVVGDTFGYSIKTENATDDGTSTFRQAPYWGWEPANLTSLRGSSYSANTGTTGYGVGQYGLLSTSENMAWRYGGSTWDLVHDGRIRHFCKMTMPGTQSNIADSTTTVVLLDTAAIDTAGLADTTDNEIEIKRDGNYLIFGQCHINSLASGDTLTVNHRINAGAVGERSVVAPGASVNQVGQYPAAAALSAADVVELTLFLTGTAGTLDITASGVRIPHLTVIEQ